MSDREDLAYYMRRAQRERDVGNCCEDNTAALAHFRLAEEYERRAAAMAGRTSPTLWI
jgi:hypothetical protein